jgi:hypothetical protein
VPCRREPVPTSITEASSRSFGSPPAKKQSKLSFVSKTTLEEKQMLDSKLAKYIYSSNCPFNVVNNPEFKDFVTALRPSYCPPSSKVLGGSLLDKSYEEIKKEVATELSGKEVVMQQDGWSTCQNQPIIAHSATAGNKNYFLSATNTGTNIKSAEYCQNLLEEQIKEAEEVYNCTVIGCVTDNCKSMQKMRNSMIEHFPGMYFYGCNSHLLNLVGQDFTPKDIMQRVVKVQNYFRQHHFESGSLTLLKGTRPVVPGDTRWNSQIECFESFVKNHAKYLEVSRDSKCKMTVDVKSTLEDIGFFKEVEGVVKKLKPVQIALDKVSTIYKVALTQDVSWHGLTNMYVILFCIAPRGHG